MISILRARTTFASAVNSFCVQFWNRSGRSGCWNAKEEAMIRIQQLKLPITHTREQLVQKLVKTLGVKAEDLTDYTIRRQSIDARKKEQSNQGLNGILSCSICKKTLRKQSVCLFCVKFRQKRSRGVFLSYKTRNLHKRLLYHSHWRKSRQKNRKRRERDALCYWIWA